MSRGRRRNHNGYSYGQSKKPNSGCLECLKLIVPILSLLLAITSKISAEMANRWCSEGQKEYCPAAVVIVSPTPPHTLSPSATIAVNTLVPTAQLNRFTCTTPPKLPCIHTVKQGETLTDIAKEYFGTDKYVQKICEANSAILQSRFQEFSEQDRQTLGFQSACDLIYPGDDLIIPIR